MSLETISTACGVAIGLAVCVGSVQAAIYVDDDAPPGGDGTTWVTAHRYLQDALTEATAGDEIRVAKGTYRPDQDEAGNVTPGDRSATFQLKSGVALFGGYAGLGTPDPDVRDIAVYRPFLYGDLAGNDIIGICVDDSMCAGQGGICADGFCILAFQNDENSYHVVTGSGTNDTAILDGFRITAANANSSDFLGGGMYNDAGNPTVTNCIFSGNFAVGGGGMANDASSPTVTDCTFHGNTADTGGGMFNQQGSGPMLTDCTFGANSAGFEGGGMYNGNSSPTVTGCLFTGNFASTVGGGMDNEQGSSPTVTNCTFNGNSAEVGGGMFNSANSPTVTNCTFNGNSGEFGGGMYNALGSVPTVTNCTFSANSGTSSEFGGSGGGMYNDNSNPTVTNCTFGGNSASSGGGMANFASSPTVINCTFSANSAARLGGGMSSTGSSDPPVPGNPTVINSTFTRNLAGDFGGGIYNELLSNLAVSNSIFWQNSDAGGMDESGQIHTANSAAVVNYSDVQGGWTGAGGIGNIDADPLFVPGPGGCYYLSQRAAGQAVDSPCVDTGSDTAANLGLDTVTTRSDEGVDSGIVDMGYHYPVTGQPLIMGDYDRDGNIDLADFAGLQNCFTGEGPPDVAPCCRIFDFEPDDDVDLDDYAAFSEAM